MVAKHLTGAFDVDGASIDMPSIEAKSIKKSIKAGTVVLVLCDHFVIMGESYSYSGSHVTFLRDDPEHDPDAKVFYLVLTGDGQMAMALATNFVAV